MTQVTLWHGTTAAAACSIATAGFEPLDSHRVLERTATAYGVDVGELTAALSDRFVLFRDRDKWVSLASSERAACNWARRAPECRWEALWGVWRVKHGGIEGSPTPWFDEAAAAWHACQMLEDEPSVIELSVPLDRLGVGGSERDRAARVAAAIELGAPEWRLDYPVPSDWVISWHPISKHVELIAAAGLLGVTQRELVERVLKGTISGCRRPRPERRMYDSWYWVLKDLVHYLPAGRLSQSTV